MATRGAKTYLAGASVLAAGLGVVLPVLAQVAEDEGGARLEATVDLGVEINDGAPEFRTGFNLDLITATRTQQLTFSGDFGVTVPLDDIEEAAFNDPRYGVDYMRDTGRSRFTFSADYSQTDIDRLRFLADDLATPFDESTLTQSDDGALERRQADIMLELGLNDPIGAELRYRYDETRYTGVTDPDLEDSRLDEVTLGLRLDADPTLSFNIDGQWRQVDTFGATPQQEVRTRIGVGATWQVWPELQLTGDLAYARITTDRTVLGVTSRAEQAGVNVSLGAELDRPNGSYEASLDRLLNAPGFVTTGQVTRTFELLEGTTLSTSLGFAQLPSGDIYPTAGLEYDWDTPHGDITLSFSTDAVINGDDDEVQRSIVSGTFRRDLPQGARWSLSGRVTDSEILTGTDPDIASALISANYNVPLTEDWDIVTGASWQLTRQDGAGDDIDNRVFFSLERRFTLRR